MILMFLTDTQHGMSDSTESVMMNFPLSLSCARITMDGPCSRLQSLMPAIIYIWMDQISWIYCLISKKIFRILRHESIVED